MGGQGPSAPHVGCVRNRRRGCASAPRRHAGPAQRPTPGGGKREQGTGWGSPEAVLQTNPSHPSPLVRKNHSLQRGPVGSAAGHGSPALPGCRIPAHRVPGTRQLIESKVTGSTGPPPPSPPRTPPGTAPEPRPLPCPPSAHHPPITRHSTHHSPPTIHYRPPTGRWPLSRRGVLARRRRAPLRWLRTQPT